jgi:hypothetical protein
MLIGWIEAEFRYVWADAMGKSARTDGGNTDPSAGAFDGGPERVALRAIGIAAAALRRN